MVTTRPSGLNRKQRRELARRLQSSDPGLEVMHPNAAGIDIGNGAHYVAVRPDRDPDPVRRFDCFTADLHRLADWLQQCGVTTVAMQSTGVVCSLGTQRDRLWIGEVLHRGRSQEREAQG